MPASLQSYPGKGKFANKVFYRIQPYLPSGKRVTFRLGSGKKQATVAAKAIGDLIDSQNAGVEPAATTKQWLESTANESVSTTLVKCELITTMPARFGKTKNTTLSMLALEYIRTRCAGLEESTVVIHQKAQRNLVDCFGDVDITALKKKDGREFWRWLQDDEDLAENTAKQRLRLARAFFELAIEDELIAANPFKARGLSTTQTAAEKVYVDRTLIQKVITCCPSPEWKCLFALVRSIPMRIPSEIRDFTWDDVDWTNNQLLIHSPKTRRLGKSARLVPIFDSMAQYLRELRDSQSVNERYVFVELRQNTNPGTTAKKIVKRARIEPWQNFFNSLRATAETDLMDEYGLRRACQWAGNSAATAMKNYALVKKTDFDDAGTQRREGQGSVKDSNPVPNSDANSDAILADDATCAAEPASTAPQHTASNPTKNALPQIALERQCVSVGAEGLEPPTLSV